VIEINKVAFDYYNIQLEIAATGQTLGIVGPGCESIAYNWKVGREKMRGGSRLPVDMTEGDADFEGKLKFNRFWWNYLVLTAGELGVGIANLEMNMGITYSKGNAQRITDTLIGVKLAGGDHSHDRGPSVLMVESALDVMNIFYNGVDIYGNRLS
jgi:hypothetical protein